MCGRCEADVRPMGATVQKTAHRAFGVQKILRTPRQLPPAHVSGQGAFGAECVVADLGGKAFPRGNDVPNTTVGGKYI
jgi:hypothetical protein